MIEVEQALCLLDKHIQAGVHIQSLPLEKSLGFTLAEDVVSSVYLPPFNQSSMDGYAVRYHSSNPDNHVFECTGEAKAGSNKEHKLNAGEACRVFTGATVPDGTDSVIMQEHVKVNQDNNSVQYIYDKLPLKGINIRSKGCNTKEGDILIPKNHILTPASIGYLATAGISQLTVYEKPKIALITTGNELVPAGKPLLPGQIYESNTITILSALQSAGFDADTYLLNDSYDETKELLTKVIKDYTFIITTGGISVGDYDFIRQVIEDINVKQVFYKVKQKPGKPIFFGTSNDSYLFALPGNPASALTCFYLYVAFALNKFMHKQLSFEWKVGCLSEDIQMKNARTLLLRANVDGSGNMSIINNQKSDCLKGFTLSNAIALCDKPNANTKKGSTMKYISVNNF